MSLLSLVLLLAVIGFLLWLLNTYIPMENTIRQLINVLVISVVILWLLQLLGLVPQLGAIQIGR